jgi:hypothetical protein
MAKMSEMEMSNSVVNDGELERGEHPIGVKVHISTVTHAWRGTLLEVTPSYYVLDPSQKIALVDSTGKMSDYMKTMKSVADGDEYSPDAKSRPTIRINRNAVSWILSGS